MAAASNKERLYNPVGHAITLHNMGIILQKQGEYEEAWNYYSQSLAIFVQLENQDRRALTLHDMGVLAQRQRRYEEAYRLYSESLAIKEQLGDLSGRASTLYQLGEMSRARGDHATALEYIIQALSVLQQLRSPDFSRTLEVLAELRVELGEIKFTKLWEEISGGRPLPDLPVIDHQRDLLLRLAAFTRIRTWTELQHAVETDSELLSIEADTLLEILAKQQDEDARGLIEQYRRLLTRCREAGITAAFAELQANQVLENNVDFTAQLNDLCHQVLVALRSVNQTQQEKLATQLDRVTVSDLPIVGARDFLVVLAMWLRGENVENLKKRAGALPKEFQNAYKRMVLSLIFQANGDGDEQDGFVMALLMHVRRLLIQGTETQRRQFADHITEMLREGPTEEHKSFEKYLECLVAVLHGEAPDTSSLEEPFTTAWQVFQKMIEQQEQMVTDQGSVEQTSDIEAQYSSIFSEVVSLLNEYMEADWPKRYQLLREHTDVLLTERIEPIFDVLLEDNQKSDALQFLEGLRILLRRCRIWGIDPAWYLELRMHLGNDITIPLEYESAVMQIAKVLSHPQANDGELIQGVEAMQTLLDGGIDAVSELFKAALLWDLADAIGQLPTDHPYRKLGQMEAYYREALPRYQAADRPLSVALLQRSLGIILTEQGYYAEALEPLQAAIGGLRVREQYREETAWVLSSYASTLDSLGRTEEALIAYNEAITLLPDRAPLYRKRAETLIHLRRLEEAEADLAHAVELDGHENSSYLWYHRAQVAIARGEGLLAEQMLDEAVQREASFDVALPRVEAAWLQGNLLAAHKTFQLVWGKANLGGRTAIRHEMERLFGEHPGLAGRDELEDIMMKVDK